MSKGFSDVEWNYVIHDKEMLAIICALEDWHHFLEGSSKSFEVFTDHKNLAYFHDAQKCHDPVHSHRTCDSFMYIYSSHRGTLIP